MIFGLSGVVHVSKLAQFLEEISDEKKDKLKILKLNIDENPQTPQKFGVRGIPTLMLFKDGKLLILKLVVCQKICLYLG